jgi:hypothetical protein
MNCKFCNNIVYADLETELSGKHTNTGWCHKCPVPVHYEWGLELPNDRDPNDKDPVNIISMAICDPNRFVDSAERYYYFWLSYRDNFTQLLCFKQPPLTYESIFKIPGILDVSPNNFYRKLKTYVTFS